MQPLKLTVSGLHSFREPVEIDLAELGQHGLFGIFGPTGSGKSTILDALTLALYGQIDRLVGRSKRGIVNHHCPTCEVRLTFRCAGLDWEVHRAYKKDKEGAAQRVHSRLLQRGPDGSAVIADKEREVTGRIESLLGLNATDFMRAVVLPQGRFMQFLHLQGADRRRMLQRLFHLEAYGETLRGRVKGEGQRLAQVLSRVQGELEGLGEADPANVETATVEVEALELQAKLTRTLMVECEARWTALNTAWTAQQQHLAAGTALSTHLASSDRMLQLESALARARQVRPVLEASGLEQAADQALQSARQDLAERQERAIATEAAVTEAQTAWTDAAEARSREEPRLAAQGEELVHAVRIEESLREATQQLGDLESARARLTREVEGARKAHATAAQVLSTVVALRTELKDRVFALRVPVSERTRIQQASANQKTLEASRARGARLKSALVGLERRLTQAATTAEQAGRAAAAADRRADRQEHWRQNLQATQLALAGCASRAQRLHASGLLARLNGAAAHLHDARERVRHAAETLSSAEDLPPDLPALAGALAAELEDHCPVCGSTEHPAPAAPADLGSWLDQHAKARVDQAMRVHTHASALAETQAAEQAHTALQEEIGIDDPAAFLEREAQASQTLQRALDRAQRTQRTLERERQGLDSLLATSGAQVDALTEQCEDTKRQLHAAVTEEGDAWQALQEALGSDTLFDLPRLAKQIADKDAARQQQEADALAATQDVERKERAASKAQKRERVAEASLETTERDHQRVSQERQTWLSQLRELVPDGTAADALADVRTRLETLATQVHERHVVLERTREARLEASTARAQARGNVQAATKAHHHAEQALQQALSALGLSETPPPAEALPDTDLDARTAEVLGWKATRDSLQATLDALPPADTSVTQHDVRAAQQAYQQAREDEQRTRETWARASERLQQLRTRAERFATLSGERTQHQARESRLQQLSKLLRGDRFVEYVANDHLGDLVREATVHLALLTQGRYALELDADGGFEVVDLDAGGARRPAHSLSGGETFLTSLALALALSTQVQRHNAQALEFFFLDEGFGRLDPEALDRVMGALESLASEHRVIGLISHIGAVKERAPRYLELHTPRDGSGTRVQVRES